MGLKVVGAMCKILFVPTIDSAKDNTPRQFIDGIFTAIYWWNIYISTCYHINFTHGLFLYRAVLLWKLYNKDVGIMTGVLGVHYFMCPLFPPIVHHQHHISSSPKTRTIFIGKCNFRKNSGKQRLHCVNGVPVIYGNICKGQI